MKTYRIKTLDWQQGVWNRDDREFVAETPFGTVRIAQTKFGRIAWSGWDVHFDQELAGRWRSILMAQNVSLNTQAAKAAAQSHWEQQLAKVLEVVE